MIEYSFVYKYFELKQTDKYHSQFIHENGFVRDTLEEYKEKKSLFSFREKFPVCLKFRWP